jgi:hypothetical protein
MATETEGKHAGGFLVAEAGKNVSRITVILKSGENLQAGAVVQKENSTGKYIEYDAGNSDVDTGYGAFGVLFDAVDASAGDADAVIIDGVGGAVVNGDELVWADDQDTGDREAGIASLYSVGIKVATEEHG